MVTCGHQFETEGSCDWLVSSSAACPIDGNAGASNILKRLIKKHCGSKARGNSATEIPRPCTSHPDGDAEAKSPDINPYCTLFLQSKAMHLSEPKEKEVKLKKAKEARIKNTKSHVSAFYDFAQFDEKQHLDGCPVKWLYTRQQREKQPQCRDLNILVTSHPTSHIYNNSCSTPSEISITDKVRLMKRDNGMEADSLGDMCTASTTTMATRHKLAVKLNCRRIPDSDDNCGVPQQAIPSRHGYMPPRPLSGLRPLLSILMSPRNRVPCCTITFTAQERVRSASVTVKSINLSLGCQPNSPALKQRGGQRWGCSSARYPGKTKKARQARLKVNLNPRQESLCDTDSVPTQSLASLRYELNSKYNGQINTAHLQHLAVEDKHSKISRFFDSLSISKKNEDTSSGSEEQLELVCSKVRFAARSVPNK